MSDRKIQEIGITNNSVDASMARYSLRQAYDKTPESKTRDSLENLEETMAKIDKRNLEEQNEKPDVVEEKTFLGIPIVGVKKWFRKS